MINKFSWLVCCLFVLTGCQTAYYAAWEKLGVEKRDILLDRVESANDAQEEAQQQFQSALEQLTQLINFDGGELQSVYESINDQYLASEESATRVSDRIGKIEQVADALFDEWRDELEQYSNESLRRQSELKLRDTERKYQRLIKSMRRSESKMAPVLSALKDNVLYLKHNLNAKAVGALKGEFGQIRVDINRLIQEMKQTIQQSNHFIKQLKS